MEWLDEFPWNAKVLKNYAVIIRILVGYLKSLLAIWDECGGRLEIPKDHSQNYSKRIGSLSFFWICEWKCM